MGSSPSKAFLNKRLDGKTAVITGSNTGIGKATAKELYRKGARVILACRDIAKAEDALAQIQNEMKSEDEKAGELVIKSLNLSSLSSIRKCAEEINSEEDKLDFLVNNAGVMMCPKSKTEDGFESHFGINHLGHYLFTCLLLPKIIKSGPARIINLSSSAHKHGEINFDDLNFEKRNYSAFGAYAQSKLANILFTLELANRLKDKGIGVYSVHPGIVKTDLGRHLDETYFSGARIIAGTIFFPFYKTPEEGALTTLYCILKDDDDNSGSYFSDCKVKETGLEQKYGEMAKELWKVSANLVNCDFVPDVK